MDDMEKALGNLLSDPNLMEKVRGLAQSLGQTSPQPQQEPIPDLDLGTLKKLSGFARQSGVDPNQRALLRALNPYISSERLKKLENAMRAAKMAKLASGFMGTSLPQLLTSR